MAEVSEFMVVARLPKVNYHRKQLKPGASQAQLSQYGR